MQPSERPSAFELAASVEEARDRTVAWTEDLSDEDLIGPCLAIVNPLLWEIGHVAWFQERWILRHALGEPPLVEDEDDLWNSAEVPHDSRWDLALPARDETFAYVREVQARVASRLRGSRLDDELRYFVLLSLCHEDMHAEAILITRQTLGFAPPIGLRTEPETESDRADPQRADAGRDVEIAGGRYVVGADRDTTHFVFDNEMWAHEVVVAPFAIARTVVTQGEFARFVDDGGYASRQFWSAAGWRWRTDSGAVVPVDWRRVPGGYERRVFDRFRALEDDRPMVRVGWFEAEAYCAWAGRRLPTEVEWEVAAAGHDRQRYPWGAAACGSDRVCARAESTSLARVQALAHGDSRSGCRQMLGTVWEWTACDFQPYEGFEPGPYAEYSVPWFRTHKVLRGGSWASSTRLLSNTFRNFYEPHRRDVWAGFRTCAR